MTSSRLRLFSGAASTTVGLAAALRVHQLGLTLSLYDSRGHLIVARRIIDSITPGWQQIGAVWLPLPHLLNVLPVQIDLFYRTGASAVAFSIASFVLAAVSIVWIVRLLTESSAASLAAVAVFALNPNIVYLQATPMTEPLLLGLTTLGVALLVAWADERLSARTTTVGVVLALACLTRYEAWPVTYAALAGTAWTRWRRGRSLVESLVTVARIAAYPTAAILGFALFSRVVIGQWFVSGDFFVPDNKAQGQPLAAMGEILWGARQLSGPIVIALAVAGCAALLLAGVFVRRRASTLIALSLGATAAVPWAAFLAGHPFRIRYMVPLVAVEAVAVGALVDVVAGCAGRAFEARRTGGPERAALHAVVAVAAIAVAAFELHPFDVQAPMVVEAQWDRVNVAPRHEVTACLKARYHGESIMASMGSLGHYMQETSRDGFDVRDFLHEGNGDIWLAALKTPRRYAGWLLIEEKAEGGDMLYKRARENPEFLDGFSRICEGAGVALYERQNRTLNVNR